MKTSTAPSGGLGESGAGALVSAPSPAGRVKADVAGKPAPADAVMFGDDAESNVAGLLGCGIGTAALVKTGKCRSGVETDVNPAPGLLAGNLASAVDRLLCWRKIA